MEPQEPGVGRQKPGLGRQKPRLVRQDPGLVRQDPGLVRQHSLKATTVNMCCPLRPGQPSWQVDDLPYPSDISEHLHLSIEDSDAVQLVHLFHQGIDFEERVKIEDSPVGRLGILAATGAQVGSGE